MNKKINVICFVLLLLLLVSAVSAADNENETLNQVQEDPHDDLTAINSEDSVVPEVEKLSATQEVEKKKVTLKAPDVKMHYRDGSKFTVTLKYKKSVIANAKIQIQINNKTFTKTTNNSGKASINLNYQSGTYSVLSVCKGNQEFEGATAKSTVTIKSTINCGNYTKYYKNTGKYSSTFYDKKGKLLKNTAVKFRLNNKTYSVKTNSKGVAKLAIDLKRGSDPEKLMAKLLKSTDLECRFSCNFNVLIAGSPYQLGVRSILNEWHAFRCECLKREFYYELGQKEAKLHLLMGLEKILVDIDKAIAIIRKTEQEKDVIPNLCAGFDIDEKQAEYIAEIKLRHLNRQYILDRIGEREKLEKEIAELESLLSSGRKLNNYIIKQLEEIKKKYGQERKTRIVYDFSRAGEALKLTEEVEYTAHAIITKGGYLKNIPLKSIMMSDNQRLKEDDVIVFSGELSSKQKIFFFTDKGQVYPAKFGDFATTKASELGDYVPAKLEMDPEEKVIFSAIVNDLDGKLAVVFENGKGVCFPMSVYETKGNRKKLTGAFSTASPVAGMFLLEKNEIKEILLKTKSGRACILRTTLFAEKSTRTSAGNQMMALKKNDFIKEAIEVSTGDHPTLTIYKKPRVPTPGIVYNAVDFKVLKNKK